MAQALSWRAGAAWALPDGRLSPDGVRFVEALIRAVTVTGAADRQTITVGSSPFSYSSPGEGVVIISGGTVSAVSLVRQGLSVALRSTATAVPVSTGDVVVVTYSATPTMTWVPR